MKNNVQKIKSVLSEMQKGKNKEWLSDPVATIGVELHEITNNFDKMKEALEEASRYFHKRANKGKWSKRINTEIEQLLESIK